MNLLLDTHAFIWWNAKDRRLADVARDAIRDPGNRVVVSAASVWEIASNARFDLFHSAGVKAG